MYYLEQTLLKNKSITPKPGSNSLYQARQDRFQSQQQVITLQNRIGQLVMQQERTKGKMELQNEETVRILKMKHELENVKTKKGRNELQDEKELEEKRNKVQRNKRLLVESVMENQQKVQQMKKKNRDLLYQESRNIDAEKQFIKQKQFLEKQYQSNSVKEQIGIGKDNIGKYWENRLKRNLEHRNSMIKEQKKKQYQQNRTLRELETKEKELLLELRNTRNEQKMRSDTLSQAKMLSTEQFRQKYPEMYEKIRTEYLGNEVRKTEDLRVSGYQSQDMRLSGYQQQEQTSAQAQSKFTRIMDDCNECQSNRQ